MLSTFLQNDGFDERVFGFGIAIPIPFPQPVGRTYAGEIAESDALAARSRDEGARVRLELRAGVLRALAEYDSNVKARDVVAQDRIDRADRTLQSIGQEVGAGRLAIRDAVVAEQTLVDFLLGFVYAKHAVCKSSVELARAASLPLERGGL
jgi:cobalt-zinc-cadmium efflux system outer membrane protein